MSSINVLLYTSKVLKNGESPIMIRIIKDRKTKYMSVGHNCHPDLWNDSDQLPKKKHPYYKELTILIEKKKAEARKLLFELENNEDDFSLDEYKQKYTKQTKKISVQAFIQELVDGFLRADKVGNAEVYKNLKRVLNRFRDKKDLMFSDIDQLFLRKFEQDLRERGLKETSLSVHFRTFRAVYSKAIEDGYVRPEKDPFKNFKVSKFSTQTAKRAITKDELKKIEALNVADDLKLEFAKDVFLFSYYCSGINIIDIAKLEPKNLKNDVLSYTRTKTKQPIIQKLLPISIEILAKYQQQRPQNYSFPILDKDTHTTESMIKNRVKKVTKQVNAGIKQLATMADLDPERMTTYVARHTFATVLKRSNVGIAQISELLGHDSLKTTQIYLDNFESEQLYQATLNLL